MLFLANNQYIFSIHPKVAGAFGPWTSIYSPSTSSSSSSIRLVSKMMLALSHLIGQPMSIDLETVLSHIGKITYDFPYIPLTATKLKKMRDRSYSRAISNMNSDSESEEIVRNGTNRSVFHKKGRSFILRIHMMRVAYQINCITNFIFTIMKIKITGGGASKISPARPRISIASWFKMH